MVQVKKGLLLAMFIPALLAGCSSPQNTQKDNPQSALSPKAQVDAIFDQLQSQTATTPPSYGMQIRQAIDERMVILKQEKGKSCSVQLSLLRDGKIESITVQKGDAEFCRATVAEIKQANIPAAPDEQTWQQYRHVALDFKP